MSEQHGMRRDWALQHSLYPMLLYSHDLPVDASPHIRMVFDAVDHAFVDFDSFSTSLLQFFEHVKFHLLKGAKNMHRIFAPFLFVERLWLRPALFAKLANTIKWALALLQGAPLLSSASVWASAALLPLLRILGLALESLVFWAASLLL